MATFMGTNGDDVFDGADETDVFEMAGSAGNDRVSGGGGADVIKGGANWNTLDSIDGGAGNDRLILASTYYRIDSSNFSDVENVTFESVGAAQTLMRVWDTALQSGETLTVDGRKLGAGGWLRFEGQLETDGVFRVYDSAGDDYMSGGAMDDTFHVHKGGADEVHGGVGWDRLVLDGDYSGATTITTTMLSSVEEIELASGSSYRLVLSDGVATDSGFMLAVADGKGALGARNNIYVDASAETATALFLSDSKGDDTMIGGGGYDRLHSFGGSDMLSGGGGSDVVQLAGSIAGRDTIDGGDGTDVLDLTRLDRGVSIDLSAGTYGVNANGGTFTGFETIYGTMSADTLTGSSTASVNLAGGDDRATLADGADQVSGGAGKDTLRGGGGNDNLAGDTGADQLYGQDGSDLLYGDSGDDRLDGGDGIDQLMGGSGRDTLLGGAGSDYLSGGSEADTLSGGTGNDFLAGGSGDDRLTGGADMDVFRFNYDDGEDVVTDFEAGFDRLEFEAFAGMAFGEIKSHLSQRGGDVRIDYDGGVVILEGVKLSDLSAGDFFWDNV